ncbi:hypothetical protein [Streptomyces sp. CC224E]|uniref:hypothetical protein n=1 Tax=Streptomyces sp. CC224E TaxID=3044174 RepID=UPI00278C3F34|nr:hypothetical protein [Streptomyces sp. CC224E]
MSGWEFEYIAPALMSLRDLSVEQRRELDGIAARLAERAGFMYPQGPEYGDPGVGGLLNHAEPPWMVLYQVHRPRRRVYIVQITGEEVG